MVYPGLRSQTRFALGYFLSGLRPSLFNAARTEAVLATGRAIGFPSRYGSEQPSGPTPPNYFISYIFGGFPDDVYATLLVKLPNCGAFLARDLWRDAADFETLAGDLDYQDFKRLPREDEAVVGITTNARRTNHVS